MSLWTVLSLIGSPHSWADNKSYSLPDPMVVVMLPVSTYTPEK